MLVEKRNGRICTYKIREINNALTEAAIKVPDITEFDIARITNRVNRYIKSLNLEKITVGEIEEIIYSFIEKEYPTLYTSYSSYNREHEVERLKKTSLMASIRAIGIQTDRDNANVGNNLSSKLLRIASETNKYYNLASMPRYLAKLHEQGDLYYHDLDCFNLTVNCLHIPTGKILEQSFNTGYGKTCKPQSITTASSLSCILLQASQNDMFGGQSHPNFDNDLAPYVGITRKKAIINKLLEEQISTLDEKTLTDVEMIIDKLRLDIRHLATDLEYKVFEDDLLGLDPSLSKTLEHVKKVIEEVTQRVESGDYVLNTYDRIAIKSSVYDACRQALQSLVFNLNTMHSRAGSQVPFSSLNVGIPFSEDAAMICQILLEEYDKGLGNHEQPIFPNIIFRVKKGVNRGKGAPYEYLYKLACRVAGHRMNPTFMNLDADFNLKYYEQGIIPATMGCRTYLCSNVNGEAGPEGRGNNAPTSINLPRIALRLIKTLGSGTFTKEELVEEYMVNLERMVGLAKDSLLYRYDVLKKLKVKDLPFVMGQGLMVGSEGLSENDSIEPILKNGTWGIGFVGLAETLVLLTGHHHGETEEARKLGLRIVGKIRELTDTYTEEYKLNFSCYATPAEGLSSKFTDSDRALFGEIEWVTSKGFYTNSFHVPVDYPISIKEKLEIEAPYHSMCDGGHISYIELDGPVDGDVVETIVSGAYDSTNISYMGINFHMRYCKDCGFAVNEQSLTCPKCGSRRIQGISRVTGYLSLDERFGKGKTLERSMRTLHAGHIGNKGYNMLDVSEY